MPLKVSGAGTKELNGYYVQDAVAQKILARERAQAVETDRMFGGGLDPSMMMHPYRQLDGPGFIRSSECARHMTLLSRAACVHGTDTV